MKNKILIPKQSLLRNLNKFTRKERPEECIKVRRHKLPHKAKGENQRGRNHV